eukprot:381777-Rhodomonas_salina.1
MHLTFVQLLGTNCGPEMPGIMFDFPRWLCSTRVAHSYRVRVYYTAITNGHCRQPAYGPLTSAPSPGRNPHVISVPRIARYLRTTLHAIPVQPRTMCQYRTFQYRALCPISQYQTSSATSVPDMG